MFHQTKGIPQTTLDNNSIESGCRKEYEYNAYFKFYFMKKVVLVQFSLFQVNHLLK